MGFYWTGLFTLILHFDFQAHKLNPSNSHPSSSLLSCISFTLSLKAAADNNNFFLKKKKKQKNKMDGVMTQEEVDRSLAESSAVFANVERTIEPLNFEKILEERLVRYGYRRETTTTDQNCVGNCVLKAVSCYVYGTDANQADVRRAGLAMLILNPQLYRRFLRDNEDWDHYIRRVSRANEDVDETFTRAIADVYALRIVELLPFKDSCIIEYIPFHRRIVQTIGMATCVHTDAMYDV